jgi:DNA-binding LacI/PurR family transcriptional regulator
MDGRATIVDVARLAGVSKGSVSVAFNDRPGVSPRTRARILSAAAELGWEPSHRARALSVSRAFALGLVVARPPSLLGADPFFPPFIAGVETVLSERGQALVLQVVLTEEAEEAGYRRLAREGRVDGVFVSDIRRGDTRIALLEEIGLPAVTLNRPAVPTPFPAVCLDDRPGVTASVGHLADLGHSSIAHVAGPSRYLHSARRQEAWRRALRATGLTEGPLERTDFSAASGAEATRALLGRSPRPTAIIYANDAMAIAGLAVARDLGLVVPDDLSVVGFDDSSLSAHVHPALTTVSTNAFDWGQRAAATLLDLVEGGGPVADVELPEAKLVVRDSTAPAPLPARSANRTARSRPHPSRSENR